MARMTIAKRAGDAANLFVRVLLTDASIVMGALTEEEWKKTLEWFKGRCAYTGEALAAADTVKDHAVPINKLHCGLHLYGNVVPTTETTNQRKGSKHYREFLDGNPAMLERLEGFIEESDYRERAETFGDLSGYCQTQYEVVKSLCEANRGYLQGLAEAEADPPEESSGAQSRPREGPLQIEFDPPDPNGAFREALLSTKRARITTYYADGREDLSFWNADRITPESNIVANIRSRPQFRRCQWQKRRITKVRVHVDRFGK